MTQVDCEHDFWVEQPYGPSVMDNCYADVTVEATCEKCGVRYSAQYTWDVTEGEVLEEGEEAFECDKCGCHMGREDKIDFDEEYDAHFCSDECLEAYKKEWGYNEEEE